MSWTAHRANKVVVEAELYKQAEEMATICAIVVYGHEPGENCPETVLNEIKRLQLKPGPGCQRFEG